jgi:hypothetical protein
MYADLMTHKNTTFTLIANESKLADIRSELASSKFTEKTKKKKKICGTKLSHDDTLGCKPTHLSHLSRVQSPLDH